ncbi:MAG: hypothetical protein GX594_00425 [Pirellulaceae bacterium]|nr:hypothetical protein [Pirellulaceae bacterium]
MEPTGIEPATSWMQTRESPVASGDSKALTPTDFPACTKSCTSEAENANETTPERDRQDDPLAAIAEAIAGLSTGDRERLAKLLG